MREAVSQALRPFRTRPIQAWLIVATIAVGVGVIVAVAALVQASSGYAQTFNQSLFARELKVSSVADDQTAFFEDAGVAVRRVGLVDDKPVVFTLDDLASAKRALPSVDFAFLSSTLVFDGPDGVRSLVEVSAVTADYFAASNAVFASGGAFTSTDYGSGARVLVVTSDFLRDFDLPDSAVGEEVKLDDSAYRIVGVLAPRDTADDPLALTTFMPLGPDLMRRTSDAELRFVVGDVSELDAAVSAVASFARSRWGRSVRVARSLPPIEGDPRDIILFVAGFASLGLLVASLNIMNLMLAWVLRRGREIGIRRALGASRLIIIRETLAEAFGLSLVGAAVGMLIGFALLRAYDVYASSLRVGTNLVPLERTALPWTTGLLAVGLALVVSVAFGLYPAIVAAQGRPVTALRRFG